MDEKPNAPSPRALREGRPLRRRGVSFNVLPLREEPSPVIPSPTPILVDYASIRERKQLNLSDFLNSDNPLTFILFTFGRTVLFFCKLFILPFIAIKYLYLLMLQVYGVRRSTTTTARSDLFSISSTPSSTSQQKPIVWILTLIDYVIIQLSRLPEIVQHLISSVRRHIDGTVLRSLNLIDTCTSHQLTRTYSMFKSLLFDRGTDLQSKSKK